MREIATKRPLGKQPREAAEKTKIKILGAALEVFAREGFPDARLRDIAARAGATHNLIRHHFGSKDDLWKAVVDNGLRMRQERLQQIVDAGQSMDPVDLFKKLIRSHVLFVTEHAELIKILMQSNSRTSPHLDYIIEKQQGIMDVTGPIFRKVQQRGYFKSFDPDSFTVYMRALVEAPIATSDLTNKVLKHDIRSEEGIALHSQRVIDFLFRRDE